MTGRAHASLALARPFSEQRMKYLEKSARKLPVEIQLGVGPAADIPARVLGFCSCAVDAIGIAEQMVGRPVNVRVFSSAHKIGFLSGVCPDPELFLPALAVLTGGLRICGFSGLISAELALGAREIPSALTAFSIPEFVNTFLMQASDHNANGADPKSYAVEHAAPSMYGDINDPLAQERLRITIGANAEARFWPIRQRVIQLAEAEGYAVSPSFGLVMRSLKRPWYSVLPGEPLFRDLPSLGAEGTILALDRCTNPVYGGNTGLRREARNAARHLNKPDAFALADAVSSVGNAAKALLRSDISVGKRLSEALKNAS